MASTSPTSLKLDLEMKTRVHKLAEAQRRTPHWIMREAIGEYVARHEARESFHQDALAAWHDFHETGVHVTAEEMDPWFDQVEKGEDALMPPCHP